MDSLSPQQRHNNMAAIHGKDTKPEMVVRKWLWNHGYRYRLNHPRLPGKPDVVLRKYRTCIFVNGCFWHGHNVQLQTAQIDNGQLRIDNSECCKIPKTNREFWVQKIVRNMQRDLQVRQQLKEKGWNVIQIWECQLKPACRQATLQSLLLTLSRIELKMYEGRWKMDEGRWMRDDG